MYDAPVIGRGFSLEDLYSADIVRAYDEDFFRRIIVQRGDCFGRKGIGSTDVVLSDRRQLPYTYPGNEQSKSEC